jgi:hypothetical protein
VARQLRPRVPEVLSMKRLFLVIVCISGAPACLITHEDGWGEYEEGPNGGARSCNAHGDCTAGCYCDFGPRSCRHSGACGKDSDCRADFRCDSRSSCVPRTDPAPGTRVDGGAGQSYDGPINRVPDANRAAPDAGTGFTPDASVSPPPDASPPSPPDALSCDAAAPGGGCTPRCQFAQQCGPGARCLEGSCQRPCTTSASCGTGASCRDGFCQPDPAAGGQCVYASQCMPTGTCINGYCHPICTRDTDCPNRADVCDRGVCRPDQRPLPPCTASAQCTGGQSCVDGLCRLACGCDADCAPWGAGAVCPRGFCVAPEELLMSK